MAFGMLANLELQEIVLYSMIKKIAIIHPVSEQTCIFPYHLI